MEGIRLGLGPKLMVGATVGKLMVGGPWGNPVEDTPPPLCARELDTGTCVTGKVGLLIGGGLLICILPVCINC